MGTCLTSTCMSCVKFKLLPAVNIKLAVCWDIVGLVWRKRREILLKPVTFCISGGSHIELLLG